MNRFVLARELTRETDRLTAAALAYEASAKFYGLFSADRNGVVAAIAKQFSCEGSELDRAWVLRDEETILGFYSAFPVSELAERQGASLRALFEGFPPSPTLLKGLREYRNAVCPIGEKGFYLSRIATDGGNRGKGIGAVLLSRFEQSAREQGHSSPLRLHVESGNQTAIGFYEKRGYRLDCAPGSFMVLAMSKTVENTGARG